MIRLSCWMRSREIRYRLYQRQFGSYHSITDGWATIRPELRKTFYFAQA